VSSKTNLQHVLPAWLELANKIDVSLGLDPAEAFERAEKFLSDLRSGQASTEGWAPDADQVEVLHALVALVCRPEPADPKAALSDLELVFNHVSALPWHSEEFGGPSELVSACVLQGWRLARPIAVWPDIETWTHRIRNTGNGRARAEQALSIPIIDRTPNARELGLDSLELILCVCGILRSRWETSPAAVRDDAEFFHRFVGDPSRQTGLDDERDYFQGELALIAGCASRVLFRTQDADRWLAAADASFGRSKNAQMDLARVAYQRLAVLIEGRHFGEVLRGAPVLCETFVQLQMPDDALKCLFLEGVVQGELGNHQKAVELFGPIYKEAQSLGNLRLVAQAANNLARNHAALGDERKALFFARTALPIQRKLEDRVGLSKLQWSLGTLLQKQGKHPAAVQAYRHALADAEEVGTRADIVALHLVIADLLLEAGQEAQAEKEIRAALPIIDEEKMMPEGIAALSLLRESLRRRQIDHGALRDLHRHLEDRTR
jgi:tetratricopeptide (TPR) repeat protein